MCAVVESRPASFTTHRSLSTPGACRLPGCDAVTIKVNFQYRILVGCAKEPRVVDPGRGVVISIGVIQVCVPTTVYAGVSVWRLKLGGAMDAYGRMGGFCGKPRTVRWERGSPKPPVDGPDGSIPLSGQFADFLGSLGNGDESALRGYVEFLLSETSVNLGTSGWEELSAFASNAFSQAVQDWDSEYEDLLDQWKEASSQGQANAIHYQLRLRHDTTVIEALADRQFLPRYGFPIAVLKLRVTAPDEDRTNRVREEDQFRLERNSLLALREYVPGSQLLAGGRLIRSRGILKHWTGENIDTAIGLRGQYTKCKNGHLYYWTSGATIPDCPFCRQPAGQSPVPYLVPQYGFSSAS